MARSGSDPATGPPGEAGVGEVIDGRYRLEAVLGSGGMGVVYRAAHVGLRRQVAVKILQPALAASPEVRSRFEREALAIGKIDHPNCVGVYDVGRLPDGSLYLAMELLDGQALGRVIENEGQLPPVRALKILAHMLRGLGHIHAAGLVHRDIKPENIYLVTSGDDPEFAKILDFGIAKGMTSSDLDDGVKLTQAGMAFGTPVYMAPEQALGNPLDGRADLYAAAVVAYELLCGMPPFYSDDKLEVMSMHTARPVPPMRERLIKNGRAVPSSIERVIARGLTKQPRDRYATAAEFLAEVETAIANHRNADRLPTESTTGAQPLVTDTGSVRIEAISERVDTTEPGGLADELEGEGSESHRISDAIDDLLAERAATPSPIAFGTGRPIAPTELAGFSGVGLGLPHTGPTGEPVFTQGRVAGEAVFSPRRAGSIGSIPSIRRKARWPRYLLGLLIASAAGVLVAVLTLPHGKPEADVTTPAGEASAALERGDPNRAITELEARGAAIEHDAQAQLVLGHAHAARHDSTAALAAYRKALALAPELETDVQLRANLGTMADDKDPAIVAAAFDLWLSKTGDPQAKVAAVRTASTDAIERRKAVRPAIDQYKLGDHVDWLASYSLDLDQEVGCEHRKEAVAKLRALGDPRAVVALEHAVARRGKTGAFRGKPVNACLTDDAAAAITYLKELGSAAGSAGSAAPGSAAPGSGSGSGSAT